ncbi:MAG TPA: hypothetical protein VFH28_01120 [Nitrososphaera sp.]|jgi:hypothetical protein|nr:hypothetical protein [Nitrososphaera sp.]
MKKTKVTVLVLVLVAMLTFAFAANSNLPYAFAHETKQFGNINIEVGWADEPSLAGQLNTVTVGISNASDDKPVPNAVAQLQATMKKGGQTKALDLLPQEQEGLYGAQVIPAQIGQYELVLMGSVSGQSINGSIPLDDVADPKLLTFPATGGLDNQVTSGAIDQLKRAMIDLSSQVDEAKATADQTNLATQNMASSVQSIKASADGAYMFSIIAVGIGLAGVAIAVIALSRREKIHGETVPRY